MWLCRCGMTPRTICLQVSRLCSQGRKSRCPCGRARGSEVEGGDAPGSAKTIQAAASWCKALWFGPDALGEGGAGIPTGVAVLALGRIRLTLLTVYALWRLDTAGMPRRAAAVPADAMERGRSAWVERTTWACGARVDGKGRDPLAVITSGFRHHRLLAGGIP